MGLVPHSVAAVVAADEADRQLRHQARLRGVSETAGPPAIIAGPGALEDARPGPAASLYFRPFVDVALELGWGPAHIHPHPLRGRGFCCVACNFARSGIASAGKYILGCWSFSLGFRPGFLPSRPYFRVCVSVSVFLSTETSLCG